MKAIRDLVTGMACGLIIIVVTTCVLALAANHFHGGNEEEVFLKWHDRAKAGHGGVISPTLLRPDRAGDAGPQVPGSSPPAADTSGVRP